MAAQTTGSQPMAAHTTGAQTTGAQATCSQATGAQPMAAQAMAAQTTGAARRNEMRVTKLENAMHYEVDYRNGAHVYMFDGRFHRGGGNPAVVTPFSEDFFYRGVKISPEIARGEVAPEKIMQITNMEVRQRAMEILGYEKFLSVFSKIHEYTPDIFTGQYAPDQMYALYERAETGAQEPIKVLCMYDPSKRPFVKYVIRVRPDETTCQEAVAHSYHLKSWDDFMFCKNWV